MLQRNICVTVTNYSQVNALTQYTVTAAIAAAAAAAREAVQ
jgi:hypothetical protein